MFRSSDLKYLRADVRANCETFIALCKEAGLNVKVTETVRDDEYQRYLAANGYAAQTATVPTFHSVKAGLAFDICKNVKGHEYDDAAFFARCGQIGKQVGFSWGGDWKSFPDRPHFQWDAHGKYTGAMIRAGKFPPEMEEYMTYGEWKKYMEQYRAELSKRPVSAWAKAAWDKLTKQKVTDGSRPGDLITREEVTVMLDRTMTTK